MFGSSHLPWSSFVGDEGWIAQVVSCCVSYRTQKIMHNMQSNIPYVPTCLTVGPIWLFISSYLVQNSIAVLRCFYFKP